MFGGSSDKGKDGVPGQQQQQQQYQLQQVQQQLKHQMLQQQQHQQELQLQGSVVSSSGNLPVDMIYTYDYRGAPYLGASSVSQPSESYAPKIKMHQVDGTLNMI